MKNQLNDMSNLDLQKALSLKEETLSNVSFMINHELRSSICAMAWIVKLLEECSIEEQRDLLLPILIDSIGQLEKLTREVVLELNKDQTKK